MEQVTIRLKGRELTAWARRGTDLMTALQGAGIPLAAPCGGHHTCGKCLVQAQGAVAPVGEAEANLLGGRSGRLACMAAIEGPCTVEIPDVAPGRVVMGAGEVSASGPLFSTGYGVAVDIGTTTVAAYLYGPQGGKPLAVAGAYNAQGQYGADVISRITFDKKDEAYTLQALICHQLAALMGELCGRAKVEAGEVQAAVLTGNTTMLHLLAGLKTGPLAVAPFTPESLFGGWFSLPLPGYERVRCYLPHCISAYVGADITCGVISSGMLHRPGTVLLVDVGTNGEMVLKIGDRLVCCSAAAGPAFEGAGISCGSGAVPGAISRVWPEGGALAYETIGGAPAVSLCGSGLIDGVAAGLELGLIEPTGRLTGAELTFPGSAVTLTQKDIRQVQLAKGAVRAGIDVMLRTCGVTCWALDAVLLCGGFGAYLSPRSAEAVGLLPPGCGEKVEVLGNAAGAGAAALLLQRAAREEAAQVAKRTACVELSSHPLFMDAFMEAMAFPEETE